MHAAFYKCIILVVNNNPFILYELETMSESPKEPEVSNDDSSTVKEDPKTEDPKTEPLDEEIELDFEDEENLSEEPNSDSFHDSVKEDSSNTDESTEKTRLDNAEIEIQKHLNR